MGNNNLGSLYNQANNASAGSLGAGFLHLFLQVAGPLHLISQIMLIVTVFAIAIRYAMVALDKRRADEHAQAGHRGIGYVLFALLILEGGGYFFTSVH